MDWRVTDESVEPPSTEFGCTQPWATWSTLALRQPPEVLCNLNFSVILQLLFLSSIPKLLFPANYREICKVYAFSEYVVHYGSSYFFDVFAPDNQKGNNISGNALKVFSSEEKLLYETLWTSFSEESRD